MKESNEKYKKKYMKNVPITFYKSKDSEILEKLDSVPSKSGYIKSLIKKDMEKAIGGGEWW